MKGPLAIGIVTGASFVAALAVATIAAASAQAIPIPNPNEARSFITGTVSTYTDPVGDAGDAPDLAAVSITPCGDSLHFDVTIAQPTELGRYGWILVGIDTDLNPYTGARPFGDEYLVIANGYGAMIGRWHTGRFDFGFAHSDLSAQLGSTDFSFTLDRSEIRARRFNFAVATLRENADLAPESGVFSYPATPAPTHKQHCGAPSGRLAKEVCGLSQKIPDVNPQFQPD